MTRFHFPNSADIPMLQMQLQKQLAIAEAQLGGAVQGKLDALKRAVDLMVGYLPSTAHPKELNV